MICLRCKEEVENLEAHELWQHPCEADEAKLLVEIYLHTQSLIARFSKQEYIEAGFINTDLAELLKRMNVYIEKKLNGEI